MEGLYFYKLVSPYSEDVTKNCRLTVNEIDSNFLNLKDVDIESVDFDCDSNVLTLTRNNGETLQANFDCALSGMTKNFDVNFDDCTGTLTFNWNGITETYTGFITDKTLSDSVLTAVTTDSSILGDGTDSNPLRLNPTYETGIYKPAIKLIDTTIGESLPTDCVANGDRYITKVNMSDYGKLYNIDGVNQIQEMLESEGSKWRVPSKEDWDNMLNAIEPCQYRNHNSNNCHTELGAVAGKNLKSTCDWYVEPSTSGYSNDTSYLFSDDMPQKAPINPIGEDKYGFSIYPTGYATSKDIDDLRHFGKESGMWTTTQACGDYYIKFFENNKAGVYQAAECPSDFYALRLVKDYDSSARETAHIAGKDYPVVMMPSLTGDCLTCDSPNSWSLWTSVNIDIDVNSENEIDFLEEPYEGVFHVSSRTVYIINEMTPYGWEQKVMKEGDTIVIQKPVYSGDSNDTEYRVITNEDGETQLVATDQLIYDKVTNKIYIIVNELSAYTEYINSKVDDEISARTEADDALMDIIESEISARTTSDKALVEVIESEISARTEDVEDLQSQIDAEVSARTEADDDLQSQIDAEVSARTEADDELKAMISGSTSGLEDEIIRAMEAEEKLASDIRNEISDRVAEDESLHGMLPYGSNDDSPYPIGPSTTHIPSFGGTNDLYFAFDGNYGTI